MNTRRQLTMVLAVSTGALIIVSLVAGVVLGAIHHEIVRMSERTSPLQVNFAKLQSGFERVSGNFTRVSSATNMEELRAVELDTDAALGQIESIAGEITRAQGSADHQAVAKIEQVHKSLRIIAQERLEAQRSITGSSHILAKELEAVTVSTNQLAHNMNALQKSSQQTLQQSKKTNQDANASIKSMLILREKCEQLRSIVQDTRLVQKKFRLNVSRDKAKSILDAMAAQPIGDRALSSEVMKFVGAFTPAFEGQNGLVAARASQLASPSDLKLAAAFEEAAKSLNGRIDALAASVSEAIDPLELSVRNANLGINEATDSMARVATVAGNTAEVNAQAHSLQALALELVASTGIAEIDRTQEAMKEIFGNVAGGLGQMRVDLLTLKQSADVRHVQECSSLFDQVREQALGANGMSALLRDSVEKRRQADNLFHGALLSIRATASEGSVRAREAELAQDSAVQRIKRLSTMAAGLIFFLGAAGLALAWIIGSRVRSSILASEGQLTSVVSGLRGMIQRVTKNTRALRGTSRDLTVTSEFVTQTLESMIEDSHRMQRSIEKIGENVGQVAAVGLTAAQLTARASEAVGCLKDASERIGVVTGIIRDLSFRTNLLALNATVEAAHAGAAGLGFTVIANEVKNLAKKSAEFTVDIDSCVAQMRAEVSHVIQSTSEIKTIITQIGTMQEEVSSSVREYSATAKGLSCRVSEIAGNCRGSHDKPGVLGMANRLASMAEELDDVCRKNTSARPDAGLTNAGLEKLR
jgi:hypothetical protein